MKVTNPQIATLLSEIATLGDFANRASMSAASPADAPTGGAPSPLVADLIEAYAADEQVDRGALFKGAIAKIKARVETLESLEVLVESEMPAAPGAPPQ